MLGQITQDLHKAENGNKAAAQRVRTTSVRFEKLAKLYRKESIQSERGTRGSKKSNKRPAIKAKPKAKTAMPKLKAKQPIKAKSALVRPRPLAIKKPTAKLPVKKIGR